jgi:threonine synthase
MAQKFVGYQCSLCGKTYSPDEVTYKCPVDGGNLDVILDYDRINKEGKLKEITSSKDTSLWRYLPILPVGDPGYVGTPLRVAGGTPILTPIKLCEELGVKKLWIKDEGRNPSASFKDRASAIVVARTREIKSEIVVTASTGNAGAALACMAAAVGQPAIIFAPKAAPQAKIAQLLIFGAQVILVDGNYDSAFDLTVEASKEFGWYCRNTGYNPFTLEGKKTAAFEIWESLLLNRKSDRPLTIFVSVGDGNIISGIHKGFKDLQKLGWLEQMPRIIGVQAEGSAAIYNTFHSGTEKITAVNADTVADSISSDFPHDGVRAVRAARQTGGTYISVTDDAIVKAIATLGKVGLFAEPAGSTAYAGLEKAVRDGIVGRDDEILVMNTGSGLKDIRTAMLAVAPAPVIEPSLKELKKFLKK